MFFHHLQHRDGTCVHISSDPISSPQAILFEVLYQTPPPKFVLFEGPGSSALHSQSFEQRLARHQWPHTSLGSCVARPIMGCLDRLGLGWLRSICEDRRCLWLDLKRRCRDDKPPLRWWIPSRILAVTGGVWMPSSQFWICASISWNNGMLCHFERFAWHHELYIYIVVEMKYKYKINISSIILKHESVEELIDASSPQVLWVDLLLHLDESTGPWYGRPLPSKTHSSKGSNTRSMHWPCRGKTDRSTSKMIQNALYNQISNPDTMIERWNQQSSGLFVHAECSNPKSIPVSSWFLDPMAHLYIKLL